MVKTLVSRISSSTFFELLSHPPYVAYALSVFLSQLAFNMMSVVLIFLIFSITRSNFSVSILVLTSLLPQVALSFLGGIIADQRNKKKILVFGNLLRGFALMLLFFNTHSALIVYCISALVSIITQFYVPAEIPMIPLLVRKNHLVLANSIFGVSFFSSVLIGYVLAGPFIDLVGRANVFLVLSFLFFIAALFAYFIPKTYRKEHFLDKDAHVLEEVSTSEIAQNYVNNSVIKHVIHDLRESYTIIKDTKRMAGAFFLLTASQIIILIIATIVPGYATSVLKVNAEKLSLILFAPAAIGTVVSAILLSSVFTKVDKNKLMNIGVFLSAFSLCFFPLAPTLSQISFIRFVTLDIFRLAIILAFIAGFANSLIFIPSQTIIQEVIPEHFRSKIYGLLFAFIGLFSLIPIILAGTFADIIGVGTVLFGVGLIIFAIGVIRIRPNFHQNKHI